MKPFSIKICLAALLLALGQNLSAQQVPVLHNYIYNPYLYNPAAAGSGEYGTASITHRRQWMNLSQGPVSSVLSAETPIRESNMGVGVMLYSDQTHILANVGGVATFAYHIPFSKDKTHKLSIGVSAGAVNKRIDFAHATVENINDLAILGQNSNQVYFDASAGIQYKFKGLTVGVSAPQLLGNTLQYSQNGPQDVKYALARHYMAMAGYHISIGKKKPFGIEPSALVRLTENLPLQVEGNLLLDWNQTLFFGAGYRMADVSSLAGTVGIRLKKRFQVSYSLETGMGDAASTAFGMTHEVSVAYRFGGKTKEMEAIEDLQKRMDNAERNNRGLRERLNEAELKIDTLIEHDSLQAMQLREMADNEARIRDLENRDKDHEREIRELREMIKNLNAGGNGGGSQFKYKKIGSINFDKNSSVLTADSKKRLDALNELLAKKGDDFVIYLAGNASNEGSSESNFALSVRRAVAVKNYMKSKGAAENQIMVLPYGEENPTTEEQKTEKDRKENRRVDIFVTETK